uniref:DNA-directed DNA polymerase n=1 Tax=Elphidium margaritaceum TaxID=933848 RepID=A0A7S0TCJ9_9EUKA
MDENRVELKKFIITKKLTKQPKDYPDPSKQPHVMVAMQMQKMGMSVQTGAFIEYIICTANRDGSDSGGGGSSKSIAQRAYHIKEIEKSMQNGSDGGGEDADAGTQVLHVDRTWYLEQQILPPVTRYCDPIPGADMAQIARALGLDGNKFAHLGTSGTGGGGGTRTGGADEDDLDMEDKILRITDRLKYRETCAPLKIECKHCGSSYDFSGVFDFNKMDATCGLVCATSNCKGIVCVSDKSVEDKALRQRDLACLKNGIALQIWHFIYAYYAREWICIDPTCNYKTRQLSSTGNGDKCPKIGCNSHLKETYTASQLFDQLKYFLFLFDRIEFGKILKQETANNKKWNNVTLTTTQTEILDELHAWIKKTILQKSRYYFLDSNLLFKYLGSS